MSQAHVVNINTLVPFSAFNDAFRNHITAMLAGDVRVFVLAVDREVLWNRYLDSFPPGTNEVFRQRREYDCSCCRSAIKELGSLAVIRDGHVVTAWDFEGPGQFGPVVSALRSYCDELAIRDPYFAESTTVGVARTREEIESTGKTISWDHVHVPVPQRLVRKRADFASIAGAVRTSRAVFDRALRELEPSAVATTLELIADGSLYRGDEWKPALEEFQRYQTRYNSTPPGAPRELFTWAADAPESVTRIRNHAIGTLLIDLSNGMDVNEAVRRYEAVVAPANYKRPKAIFTASMLKAAEAAVTALGLHESLGRRFAHLDDIGIADTMFVDRDAAPRLRDGNVFAAMAKDVSTTPKSFETVAEIALDRFLAEVVPSARSIELLVEPRHRGNAMSLLAPMVASAPSLFRWSNAFSWAYGGNVADAMKERVKAAGGRVDGVVRFSIQWNAGTEYNGDDLDARCREPLGNVIYFARKSGFSGGVLDVDIVAPHRGVPAVENITWATKATMQDGDYVFSVNQFSSRGGADGFDAELEVEGVVYEFHVRRPIRQNETVDVVTLRYHKGVFTVVPVLTPAQQRGGDVWGLATGGFHRVTIVTASPNFWAGEPRVGNEHVFFMLDGASNPETPNGFYNEFLKPELQEHKRVFEALGARMRVAPDDQQLSGLGFSKSLRSSIVARVTGETTRVMRVTI